MYFLAQILDFRTSSEREESGGVKVLWYRQNAESGKEIHHGLRSFYGGDLQGGDRAMN